MVVTPEDIQEGFAHLSRFAAIHHGNSPLETIAATLALGEYLGMDQDGLVELHEQAHNYAPKDRSEAARWVIMGFLLGMTTVNRAVES